VSKKSMVFWVVISRSSEKGRHFGETYRLRLQGLIVSQARNKHEPGNKLSSGYIAIYLRIEKTSSLNSMANREILALCIWGPYVTGMNNGGKTIRVTLGPLRLNRLQVQSKLMFQNINTLNA
jgi:hypothetical protein